MTITYRAQNKKYLPLIYVMMNFEGAAAFLLFPTFLHKHTGCFWQVKSILRQNLLTVATPDRASTSWFQLTAPDKRSAQTALLGVVSWPGSVAVIAVYI